MLNWEETHRINEKEKDDFVYQGTKEKWLEMVEISKLLPYNLFIKN